VLEAYARWAPAYASDAHNPLMGLEQQAVLELLPALPGRRALDLACGSGRYLKRLSAGQAAFAFGLDFSGPMLSRAAELRQPLVQGDLLRLPLAAGSVDLVVCGLAVGHVADLGRAVSEMARVLAPGGVVVYSDFHPFGALAGLKRTFRAADQREYAARHHVHLYAAHQAACAQAGLTIDAVREPLVDDVAHPRDGLHPKDGLHPFRGFPVVLVVRAVRTRHT
jgi:malonyl-CoA O-methyltransferase